MTRTEDSDRDGESTQGYRTVGIGDYAMTAGAADLAANGIGSCVGIALVDERAGVAGLVHAKRPTADEAETTGATFADTGIERLVDAMEREGAKKHRIEAKLAGGSSMLDSFSGLGERNVAQARATLERLDIPLLASDVGGDTGRSLRLDGESGELTITSDTDGTDVL